MLKIQTAKGKPGILFSVKRNIRLIIFMGLFLLSIYAILKNHGCCCTTPDFCSNGHV